MSDLWMILVIIAYMIGEERGWVAGYKRARRPYLARIGREQSC